MLTMRKVRLSDRDDVFRILKELDLEYPGLTLDHFWVAELDGALAAVARLEELEAFCFLSALGTTLSHQGRGLAAQFLQHLLQQCGKDVYLYTVIPKFFKKFGFKTVVSRSGLPARQNFNCEACEPEQCRCMRWKP